MYLYLSELHDHYEVCFALQEKLSNHTEEWRACHVGVLQGHLRFFFSEMNRYNPRWNLFFSYHSTTQDNLGLK